jgi:hypothetical protein
MSELDCAQLRARIARDERALGQAVVALRDAAVEKLDPRAPVRAHPIAWLAGAIALGLLVGMRASTTRAIER